MNWLLTAVEVRVAVAAGGCVAVEVAGAGCVNVGEAAAVFVNVAAGGGVNVDVAVVVFVDVAAGGGVNVSVLAPGPKVTTSSGGRLPSREEKRAPSPLSATRTNV
jgi:hypothetical protein